MSKCLRIAALSYVILAEGDDNVLKIKDKILWGYIIKIIMMMHMHKYINNKMQLSIKEEKNIVHFNLMVTLTNLSSIYLKLL